MLRRSLVVAVFACVLVVGSSPASAQCFGPDNLDVGTCCQPTFAVLPNFPAVGLPGLGICWTQCSVSNTRPLKVTWNAPAAPSCAEFTTTLLVSDGGSGAPLLTGTMVLDYTRTWNEVDPSGNMTQVWRFTTKADLQSLVPLGSPAPCPVPNCLAPVGPFGTAFFYGYVDYSNCNASGPWDNVLVLYHASDRFIHAPGLSNHPGTFHPTGSFAIVAPNSSLQPFIPGNNIAAGGPVFGEATRNVNVTPPPVACMVEDHVLQGTMTKLGAGCINTMSTNPKQQTLRQFNGTTNCVNTAGLNGAWASLIVNFPVLPWFHMVTTSIGTWGNPNLYPGKEQAWVDEGLFVHQDACTGNFVELKYGGSTEFGWKVLLPIPVLVSNFTDIADNYTAPLGGPYPTPIMGSVMPTNHLIYVNEP
jgi:hypothetical protein